MSNEKDRRRGWCERAGRRLDEFGQWVARRCGAPLRRVAEWIVQVVETAVKAVASAVRTAVEFVIQNQTVKTILSGAKVMIEATDKALHIRECYKRMVWLATWFAALIQQTFCITNGARACTSALLCNNAYAVALAVVVMASLFILYFLGTVMRA